MTEFPSVLEEEKRATVLVMEDDAWVRNVLTRQLTHLGYAFVEYPDAAPALAEVDFEAVDLIITDLQMPLRGDLAIEIIRSRGITTPILVLSGFLQAGDVECLQAIGADKVLAKPYDLQTLLDAMQALLAGGRRAHE